MKPEHTPLPWEIGRVDGKTYPYSIFDASGYNVCSELELEHAEYVVTACNAYPKLVEALAETLYERNREIDKTQRKYGSWNEQTDKMQQRWRDEAMAHAKANIDNDVNRKER